MKIAVLTDSSAYLTKEQQEQYHIDVVPIPLIWGDKTYYDLVDISYEDFYQKSRPQLTCQRPLSHRLAKLLNSSMTTWQMAIPT